MRSTSAPLHASDRCCVYAMHPPISNPNTMANIIRRLVRGVIHPICLPFVVDPLHHMDTRGPLCGPRCVCMHVVHPNTTDAYMVWLWP